LKLLTVYSKPDCHLCKQAIEVLERIRLQLPFELRELDITRDESLHRKYFERIPVITLDGEELFEYFVDEAALTEVLRRDTISSDAQP
jgi:glutaredoxin